MTTKKKLQNCILIIKREQNFPLVWISKGLHEVNYKYCVLISLTISQNFTNYIREAVKKSLNIIISFHSSLIRYFHNFCVACHFSSGVYRSNFIDQSTEIRETRKNREITKADCVQTNGKLIKFSPHSLDQHRAEQIELNCINFNYKSHFSLLSI